MSYITYPSLVLNRKFTSSGRPYWSAELRFDEGDTEQRDIDVISLPAARQKCLELWSDEIAHIAEVPEPDDLSPGQYVMPARLNL